MARQRSGRGGIGRTAALVLVAALLLLGACGFFEDEGGGVQPLPALPAVEPLPTIPAVQTFPVRPGGGSDGCPDGGVDRADGFRSTEPVPTASYDIVASYPHDPAAFTQGLDWHEGTLYESTGINGQSSLREVDLASGEVRRRIAIPSEHFGEGMTIVGDRVVLLTWRSHVGFVYGLADFGLQREFPYEGEGWGLTHDGQALIMSDGTHRIRFLDPETFATTRCIGVYDSARPLVNLNELEYVRGEIWANVWQTDRIARIDPASGALLGWLDLTGLLPAEERTPLADVLNGIAYDPEADRLFVTGKRWPKLYEIRLR